jgi:hypothetical protein
MYFLPKKLKLPFRRAAVLRAIARVQQRNNVALSGYLAGDTSLYNLETAFTENSSAISEMHGSRGAGYLSVIEEALRMLEQLGKNGVNIGEDAKQKFQYFMVEMVVSSANHCVSFPLSDLQTPVKGPQVEGESDNRGKGGFRVSSELRAFFQGNGAVTQTLSALAIAQLDNTLGGVGMLQLSKYLDAFKDYCLANDLEETVTVGGESVSLASIISNVAEKLIKNVGVAKLDAPHGYL